MKVELEVGWGDRTVDHAAEGAVQIVASPSGAELIEMDALFETVASEGEPPVGDFAGGLDASAFFANPIDFNSDTIGYGEGLAIVADIESLDEFGFEQLGEG